MIFLDTETCGLYGMPVLIQYAVDDGEIILFSPWEEPISETLALIEMFASHEGGVCGFNLAFDWFQLVKCYTVFSLFPDHSVEPIDHIDEIAYYESQGRDGPCLKPVTACDIMLHARKGPYQSTMDRGDIYIRRVPEALAEPLAAELERRIVLPDIYFAKKKNKHAKHWAVKDIEDEFGEIDTQFRDVFLAFRPSSALKALAVDALKIEQDTILLFQDVEYQDYPEELGYAPFALAIGTRGKWNGAWPAKIENHSAHWKYNALARKYAAKDVEYTRALWRHLGSPPPGDDDSILACMVACVRWRGFIIDVQGLRALREKTIASKTKMVDGRLFEIPTDPAKARIYITAVMDRTEALGATDLKRLKTTTDFESSTKKVLLQDIAKWLDDCKECFGEGPCPECNGTGAVPHKAALRAAEVLSARQAKYEINLYDKFILAGRFHASFDVIGALSSRMAGGDGLNAQGIKKTQEVRSKFPLTRPGIPLCGGDFSSFEVTLAEACYKDPALRKQLLTCDKCGGEMKWDSSDFLCILCGHNEGKSIHTLFGLVAFPGYTYETMKATKGTTNDLYAKSKSAVFAMFYGGNEHTLMTRLGVSEEDAAAALVKFHRQFPGVKKAQERILNTFCSMRQVGGIGSRVEWHQPADYIESLLGFRRYFTLENKIAAVLFQLAQKVPKSWSDLKITVRRRDRDQKASGAVQSALYGAAFAIQSSNVRAATNHEIQSSGAQITKNVQRKIWDLQPSGSNPWLVQPFNVHDEIMCPTVPEMVGAVAEVVHTAVESFRSIVPLIKLDWDRNLKSWADK